MQEDKKEKKSYQMNFFSPTVFAVSKKKNVKAIVRLPIMRLKNEAYAIHSFAVFRNVGGKILNRIIFLPRYRAIQSTD